MKLELLAPAGSMANLKAAIQKGADSVYLGMGNFTARSYATNFNQEYLRQAVKICRSNNVKLYLTMNTLVKNQEFKQFFNQLSFAYSAGIDSVIIQQTSFLDIIKKSYPDLKVHISTQAGVMNSIHANLLKNADRINLARELSKNQIASIRSNFSKEIEIFCHGALCSSVSGNCLFSSLLGGRSGNRGKCAQPCRKKYNGKYLLSTKELCLIHKVPEIINMGIDSVKIEGRMRTPYYVAAVTSAYREAIDNYYNQGRQGHLLISNQTLSLLKTAFTREFTEGRYSSQNVFNTARSNATTISKNEIYSVNVNNNIKINRNKPITPNLAIHPKSSPERMLLVRSYSYKDACSAFDNGADVVYFDLFSDEFCSVRKDFPKRRLYGVTPRIMLDRDFEVIKSEISKQKPDGLLIGNPAALKYNLPVHFDYNLNYFNDIDVANAKGLPIISPELSLNELEKFKAKNFAVLVHGKIRLMTLFHDVKGVLKDERNSLFYANKIYNGSEILNEKEIGLFKKSKQFVDAGINKFFVDT
ncbi:MAG: U32 family peptidase, partial [Candidatus Woesearchaeota archaeon]